jgi:uncharacterized protein YgiM (DUF1202 family)
MRKAAIGLLYLCLTGFSASAGELALAGPVQATALDNPTCLHVEPDADSDYVICVQKGATVTLVGRMSEKADGDENYWWKVELPDGSNAWVFGAQVEIERPGEK